MVRGKNGQALVLVTLALFAMCGLMGLAVDLGWSFYIEKTSQAAVDSAALAAVLEVRKIGGKLGPYDPTLTRTNSVGGTVEIAGNQISPVECPDAQDLPLPTDQSGFYNWHIACLYAERNGFSRGSGTRQNVRVSWGNKDTSPAPEVPDVDPVFYWTTVYAAQSVPQLFSAVMGNTEGLVASKATAAIIDSEIKASLILLNRRMDCVPLSNGGPACGDRGTNLRVQANQNCPGGCPAGGAFSLMAGGGIIASSSADGTSYPQEEIAAIALGNSMVRSPSFVIRDDGTRQGTSYAGPNAKFDVPSSNSSKSELFTDPFEGVPNPPLPERDDIFNVSKTLVHDFPGGQFPNPSACTQDSPCDLFPGIYTATGTSNGQKVLTGDPIRLAGGYFRFVDTGGAQLDNFIFLGGLDISGANVTIGSGRYFMLGALPQGSNPGKVLSITSGSNVSDGLAYNQSAEDQGVRGQIFVLAGPNYPNESTGTVADIISRAAQGTASNENLLGTTLRHGSTEIQLGANNGSLINIHGLTGDDNVSLGDTRMEAYRKVVMWQDRDNSVIDYEDGENGQPLTWLTATNAYDCNEDRTSCTAVDPDTQQEVSPVEALDYPVANSDLTNPDSVELSIAASPDTHIYGIVEQGRGTYTYMQGGGGYSGPIQIITGAFRVQGNAQLDLGVLPKSVTRRIVALIQ